ncbi:hypothetical protein BpHYR1_002793 [Brachionus plicatilis]|uniref:Uncharacterized protein n=1 Tax=Brachionus plicatilis TaxID=10195 RepID=A0A3M7P219_BRAPC|nr:hypothetical protein BpHYR1_002793 [Brachionus plicatilis]
MVGFQNIKTKYSNFDLIFLIATQKIHEINTQIRHKTFNKLKMNRLDMLTREKIYLFLQDLRSRCSQERKYIFTM